MAWHEPSQEAICRLFPQISPIRCYKERELLKLVPISRSKFAEMCRNGIGPREMRIGAAKLFREVDVVEWLAGLYTSDAE